MYASWVKIDGTGVTDVTKAGKRYRPTRHVLTVHGTFHPFCFNVSMSIGIEDLKAKRDAISERVLEKQEEKLKIQNDMHILSERLARVTDDLTKMITERDDYDREYMHMCSALLLSHMPHTQPICPKETRLLMSMTRCLVFASCTAPSLS